MNAEILSETQRQWALEQTPAKAAELERRAFQRVFNSEVWGKLSRKQKADHLDILAREHRNLNIPMPRSMPNGTGSINFNALAKELTEKRNFIEWLLD